MTIVVEDSDPSEDMEDEGEELINDPDSGKVYVEERYTPSEQICRIEPEDIEPNNLIIEVSFALP